MRHISTIIAIILCSISFSWASQAINTPIKIVQKDGSTLTIRIHGDEFKHYTTTTDGYQIVWLDGVYYYYEPSVASKTGVSVMRASDPAQRGAAERAFLASRPMGRVDLAVRSTERMMQYSFGNLDNATSKSGANKAITLASKAIIVLVQYQDIRFQNQHNVAAFKNLLNQTGYNLNGATGSAKDYYHANSLGVYKPQFDISPIVTLPHNRDYYGENDANGSDKNADLMVVEGCKLASQAGVDFSQYDYNKDGKVDNVFVYYAGNNEAEGAPAGAVWPHRWALYNYRNTTINGVKVWDYACSSELRGSGGTTMCGIGTFCHEFGHVLGLPDMYDTDGVENGKSVGLYNVSIMSGGNYNNGGNTPPYYSAMERAILGWNKLVEIKAGETLTIEPIHIKNDGLKISSKASPDEFYLIESRNNVGWDAPFNNNGLLIYHIDRSNNDANGVSAISRWSNNTVNNNTNHECIRLVESVGRNLKGIELNGTTGYNKIFYPGVTNNRSFTDGSYRGIDWKGNPVLVQLLDINQVNGVVTLTTSSLIKGDENLSIEVGQKQAIVTILTDIPCDSFVIAYKRNTTVSWAEIAVAKDEKRITIGNLLPGTNYDFQLLTVNGGTKTVVARVQNRTEDITAPFTAIKGILPTFAVEQTIPLQITNMEETPSSVVFSLDGNDIADSKITFTMAGKFTLRVVITYKNGNKEIITRKITVQ